MYLYQVNLHGVHHAFFFFEKLWLRIEMANGNFDREQSRSNLSDKIFCNLGKRNFAGKL